MPTPAPPSARLSDAARAELIAIARESFASGDATPRPPADAALEAPGAAFVSVYVDGRLRGCIGLMAWDRPVHAAVRYAAVQASRADRRFAPLRADELADCGVEISVLSPLREITHDAVEVGRHGLVVSRGHQRGVLLPQVPTKYGWTAHQFLEQTCAKARLHADAWREPETRVEAFEAEVFSDGPCG